jgi:hypothetical protein
LDPGSYFDCGNARLRGLDEALLREAERRGRTIGDDVFQLVATDTGLIYCRPSIAFAIAARWDEIVVEAPRGDGPVVLEIGWPVHGPLKFTVSGRLAGNVYRRWQQRQGGQPPARSSRPRKLSPRPETAPQAVDRSAATPTAPAGSDVGGVAGPEVGRVAGPEVLAEIDGAPMVVELSDLDAAAQPEPEPEPDPDPDPELESESEPRPAPEPEPDPEPVLELEPEAQPEPEPVLESGPEPVALPPEPVGSGTRPQRQVRRRVVLSPPEPITISAPKPDPQPSWVGSPMSFAGVAAALTLVVLVGSVLAAVYRTAGPSSPTAAASPRTTVDHQRFKPGAENPLGPTVTQVPVTQVPVTQMTGTSTPVASIIGTPTTGLASTSSGIGGSFEIISPNGPEVSEPEGGDVDGGPVVPRRCDANYSGCVPVVIDVDCAGQGDGPVFLDDPSVVVMGQDIYDLDSDGDGLTCEPDQPTAGPDS